MLILVFVVLSVRSLLLKSCVAFEIWPSLYRCANKTPIIVLISITLIEIHFKYSTEIKDQNMIKIREEQL